MIGKECSPYVLTVKSRLEKFDLLGLVFGATTFSITRLSITTLSIAPLRSKTLSTATLGKVTLSLAKHITPHSALQQIALRSLA